MKNAAAILLAAAGTTSAAMTAKYSSPNPTNTFSCPKPNGAFCVGSSLTMPILMDCVNDIPKMINCTEQEHIRPPLNTAFAPCWESAPAAGDAACSKDCMLYPSDAPPLPVPGSCTPSDGDSTGNLHANSNETGTQAPPSTSLGANEAFSLPAPPETKRETETPSYTEPGNEPTPLTAPGSGPEQKSESLPADLSTLPTASLPSYVTTATAAAAPFTSHPMQSSSRPPFPFPFPMSSGEGFPPFPLPSGGAPPFPIPSGGAPPFPLPSGGFPPFPMPTVITTTVNNCGSGSGDGSPAPEITNPSLWNGATVTVTTTVTEISSSGPDWMSSLFVTPSASWSNSSSSTTTTTTHAAGPGPKISPSTTTRPDKPSQSSVESSGSGLNLSDRDFYAYVLISLSLSLVVAWLA